MQEFAVILHENRNLGFVLDSYIIEKKTESEFYKASELITSEKFSDVEKKLSEFEKDICKELFHYEDKEIFRIFCKKKQLSVKSFVDSIPSDLLEKHVRPFVEKYMAKAIVMMLKNNVPLYIRMGNENLYNENRISYANSNCETVFSFVKESEGLKYRLSLLEGNNEIDLKDRSYYIVSNDPCNIIISDSLFSLPKIDAKKLKPFFNKEYIAIPNRLEEQYFQSFVLNSIKNFKVHAHGFNVDNIEADPKPILKLENNLNSDLIFILYFQYDKELFEAARRLSKKVFFDYTNQQPSYKVISRDPVAEKKLKEKIGGLGLEYVQGFWKPIGKNNYQWLTENKEALQEMGIDVKMHDINIDISNAQIKTEINEDLDWFDLKVKLTYGKYKIPFKKILNNIRAKDPVFTLPNGEIAILPEEWFAEFGPLVENNEISENSIHVKKHHFGQLVNLQNITQEDKEKYLGHLINLLDDSSVPELPSGLKAELRPYQVEGYNWLVNLYKNELGGILADDMGLGKTLQTIALLKKVIDDNRKTVEVTVNTASQPMQLSLFDAVTVETKKNETVPCSLVVVPTSLVFNWQAELEKFAPTLKVGTYFGSNREQDYKVFENYEILISTYGVVRNDVDFLENYEFLYVILDESQIIKNPNSKIYKAVTRLDSQYRLVLTGTPIENNLAELWSQMNFLNDGILGNLASFSNKYVKAIEGNDEDVKERLKTLISPFIKRRSKKVVARDLPDVSEQVILCDMTEEQAKVYEEEKSKVRNLIAEKKQEVGMKKIAPYVLQALTKLRLMSNHPRMVEDYETLSSGKYEEIKTALDKVLKRGHKVLIFSSFVKHLEIIREYIVEIGEDYSMIVGSTRDRQAEVRKFQENDNVNVFLISLKAGGVGLNLTAADYVFILDPWWNPASENQAVSRAHRIGQENKVFVYRFISVETIEQKILRLQDKKRKLAEEFITDESNVVFDDETLEYLFE